MLALPARDVVVADVSLVDVERRAVIQTPSLLLDLPIVLLSFRTPRRFQNHEPAHRIQQVADQIKERGLLIFG